MLKALFAERALPLGTPQSLFQGLRAVGYKQDDESILLPPAEQEAMIIDQRFTETTAVRC